jgi:hypothetical protein
MSEKSLFDLSELAVESIDVRPGDALERLDEGHGMGELAGSSRCGPCVFSAPNFVEDDLL